MDNHKLNRILYNMADLLHDRSDSFCEYKKTREIYQEIQDSMTHYIHRNQINADRLIHSSPLKPIELKLDDYIDYQIQLDLIQYQYLDSVLSLVDFYLLTKRFNSNYYRGMLESMRDSRLGIYRLIDRNERDAVVVLDNVMTHEQIQITDKYLGQGDSISLNEYLILRIIECEKCCFRTGLILNYPNLPQTRQFLNRYGHLFLNHDQLNAFIEAYHFYQSMNQSKKNRIF